MEEREYLARQKSLRQLFRSINSPEKAAAYRESLMAAGWSEADAETEVRRLGRGAIAVVKEDLQVATLLAGIAFAMWGVGWYGQNFGLKRNPPGPLVGYGTLAASAFSLANWVAKARRLRRLEEEFAARDADGS
jgi:hypothetical protein